MPCKFRINDPGAMHHIIVRGIERRRIFSNDQDQDNFVEQLGDLVSDTETFCFAWALIPTHAHILLRTGQTPLSTVMRRLLTGYAVSYNRRHRRHGHLFQNRYKSILCQEDNYLLELVRYIHLNSLRAKIVKLTTRYHRRWVSIPSRYGHTANTRLPSKHAVYCVIGLSESWVSVPQRYLYNWVSRSHR